MHNIGGGDRESSSIETQTRVQTGGNTSYPRFVLLPYSSQRPTKFLALVRVDSSTRAYVNTWAKTFMISDHISRLQSIHVWNKFMAIDWTFAMYLFRTAVPKRTASSGGENCSIIHKVPGARRGIDNAFEHSIEHSTFVAVILEFLMFWSVKRGEYSMNGVQLLPYSLEYD